MPIEEKIDSANMNPEMVRLGKENTVDEAARDRLMGVTSDENYGLGKFRDQSSDAVCEIIAAGPRFQSHVTAQYDRVCALASRSGHRVPHRLDRILKFDSPNKVWPKPKWHSWCGHSDDGDFDPGDFLQDEWLNPGEWM